MIHGFEGVQKVAAALLSAVEREFIAAIRAESKAIAMGHTVDALINAGNAARLRLMRRVEQLPVETLIRKVMTKSTYCTISHAELQSHASVIEGNYLERLARLRNSRRIAKSQPFSAGFLQGLETVASAFKADVYPRDGFLQTFTEKLLWTKPAALNLFTTLDQKGANSVNVSHIKAGLSLFLCDDSCESCFRLLFLAFAGDETARIDPSDAIDAFSLLDLVLDIRNCGALSQNQAFFDVLAKADGGTVGIGDFVAIGKGPFCVSLVDSMKGVLDEKSVPRGEAKLVVDFEGEGSMEEVSSPCKTDFSDVSESVCDSPLLSPPKSPPSEPVTPSEDEDPSLSFVQDFSLSEPKEAVFSSGSPALPPPKPQRSRCGRLCSPQTCNLS